METGIQNSDKYDDWYVVSVKTGREDFIKDFFETHNHNAGKAELMIFSREFIHKKDGKYSKVLNRMFPGYIFVHGDIHYAVGLIKKYFKTEYIRPVCFGGAPAKVKQEEMRTLLRNCNSSGIIALSYGRKTGKIVNIIKGPLKDMHARLVFINEKKRKAQIEIALLGRRLMLNLGIDFINGASAANMRHENVI